MSVRVEVKWDKIEHTAECWGNDMTACDCVPGFLALLNRRPESRAELDELVASFYKLDGNIVGGTLHVVLDDFNWERHHIEFCRGCAREKGDVAGERFADLLLTLTDEQLQSWLAHPDEQNGATCE